METKATESISAAEAAEIVHQQQAIEDQMCAQEIQQVLSKWQRTLVPVAFLTPEGRIVARLEQRRIES